MLRKLAPLGLSLVLAACGGGAVGPALSANNASAQVLPSDTPADAGESPASGDDALITPAPPPECKEAAAAPEACSPGNFNEGLAQALTSSSPARALRCLEQATEAPPGLLRALRADLNRQCADVIVGDSARAPGVARDVSETLLALSVGARLFRSVRKPPLPQAPFSKAEFEKHFKEVLTPWIKDQAHTVDLLAQAGPRLSGYAKAIVALEAGLADMRFVNVARAIELPEELQKDTEFRETYLVSLEQALEPRVVRGRDAALVGLGELQRQGILKDARLSEVRTLLSTLFAGRRIDALDRLLLPPLPAADLSAPALVVAAKLPAFYSLKLATNPNVDDPKLLRARLEQGVPPALWLNADAKPASPELAALQQRGLFQLGQTYFWAEPFARAGAIETPAGDTSAALVHELSKVLARGPRNAAALMLGPTTLPPELREVSAVDALAKQKSPAAGMAEFDAAYLRSLAPPANDPAFWKDQKARFERAAKKLEDAAAKATATDLAKAAAATETELRKNPKP